MQRTQMPFSSLRTLQHIRHQNTLSTDYHKILFLYSEKEWRTYLTCSQITILTLLSLPTITNSTELHWILSLDNSPKQQASLSQTFNTFQQLILIKICQWLLLYVLLWSLSLEIGTSIMMITHFCSEYTDSFPLRFLRNSFLKRAARKRTLRRRRRTKRKIWRRCSESPLSFFPSITSSIFPN